MKSRYLRTVAVLVFLSVGAYLIGGAAQRMTAPETVSAERVSVSSTIAAEGQILRDEVYIDCPYDTECFTVSEGQRVSAGALIYSDEMGKSYYSPCGGFFAGDRIVRGGWCFKAVLESAEGLYVGKELSLALSGHSYPAELESLEGNAVLIRCREGLCDVLFLDSAEAELCLGSVTGISVPEGSVLSDGESRYVYILKAGIPKKQSVNIIYKTEGGYIVSPGDIGVGAEIIKNASSVGWENK